MKRNRMTTRTRRLLMLVFAAAITGLLAACGGDEPTAAPTTAPATAAPTAGPTSSGPGPTATRPPSGPGPTAQPTAPGPTAMPGKAAWETEWEQTIAAANQEGKLVVTIFRADDRAAAERFEEVFPDIDVEAVVLSGRDAGVKVPAERKAGLYQYDVWLSGGTTMINTMIPLGKESGDIIFGDMRSQLFRPDVIDDSNWIGTFDDHWIDDQDDRNVLFKMYADPSASSIWVNTQKLPPDQIRSADDLFKLALKGKWCADDPRSPGAGATFFTEQLVTKGEDFVKRLLNDTGLRIGTDGRAMAQDLIRGDMYACVGAELDPFREQGVAGHLQQVNLELAPIAPEYSDKIIPNCCGEGKNASTISGFYSASISGPAIFTKAPHPNAAKLFVNWLLTHEGQVAFNEPLFATCSSRVSMLDYCKEHANPPFVLEDGKAFITFHSQTNVPYRRAAQDVAREVFGR